MEKTEELLDLAKTEFPDLRLTLAEQRLFREILQGDRIDFGDEDPDKNNPREAGDWREDRTIRAHCIEWLATDKRAKEHITHRGIRMKAARVDGKINLQYADLGFPLELYACALTESLMLGHARLKTLSLQGSLTKGIDAEGVTIDGNLLLSDGFKAKGEVCLSGANIGGQLDCTNAQFHNPEGDALSAENAEVKGDVFLRDGFKAEGKVRLLGANIGGQLNCTNAQFHNPEGDALNAESAEVKSDVFLRDGFKAEGEVCLSGANIGGQLDCTNAQFHNPEGDALSAENAEVKGHVFLRDGFKAEGKVRLLGANIGGQLDCTNAQFHNPEGDALSAENAEVKSDVFLRDGCKAEGKVRLLGANIGGQLDCTNAQFHNPEGDALSAENAEVKGHVFLSDGFKAEGKVRLLGANIGGQLNCTNAQFHNPEGDALNAESAEVKSDVFLRDGFKAEGEVCLSGANIGGQLDCTNAQFHNPEGDALSAENAEVKGHVFLRDGFKAEGKVRLLGANIGGQLDCTNAQFHNPEGDALSAENAEVKSDVFLRDGFKAEGRISLVGASVNGSLIWISVKNPNVTVMDLRGARVGSLWDSADSWPESGNLYLHNFCYDEIDDEAPHEAKERIQWLRLQPEGRFYPQPYEQLANVLREKGYERAAKRIHIAKNVDRRKRGNMPLLFRPLHSLLGLLTGYGYRPWRPIFVALVLIGIGWGLFYAGGREGIVMRVRSERFVPSSEQNGDLVQPNFHPLLYSFDVFLPVITFEHTEHWAPNENETGRLICKIPINGLALCGYKWFLNVAGWVLTTLFITTLTGTIRRRL